MMLICKKKVAKNAIIWYMLYIIKCDFLIKNHTFTPRKVGTRYSIRNKKILM